MSGPQPDSEVTQIPEELPPVQPPSIGFIFQLFVVPAVIVGSIAGAVFLFNRLGRGDYDWQGLVVELQHPNPHRRWRGALGLAQILSADQKRGAAGQHLAVNRELAQALNDTLVTELQRGGNSEKDYEYQAYLARTLGLFDLPEAIFPALTQAMRSEIDRDVRKNAIGSVATMTDRMTTAGTGTPYEPFAAELLTVSTDGEPLIRQLSAFALGLFPQVIARERLKVLVDDTDADTRINAAIGLARQGETGGIAVFREVLERPVAASPGSHDEFEQFVALKNCLEALRRLTDKLAPEQRQELIPLVKPIADSYREPMIRIAAQSALMALQSTGHSAQ